jgi:hypothetical protein
VTYVNARNNSYGASLDWGQDVHARGWHAGVKVTPRMTGEDQEYDIFEVWATSGTNGGRPDVLIGTVYDTVRGPVFVPANMPRGSLRHAMPGNLRRSRMARRKRRGPDYSDAHYAERRAESRAQRDEETRPAPAPPAPTAYPVMAYVYDGDRQLVESVLVYSLEQWAGLVSRQPAGYRVLDSDQSANVASTAGTASVPHHLRGPRLDTSVFGPEDNLASGGY